MKIECMTSEASEVQVQDLFRLSSCSKYSWNLLGLPDKIHRYKYMPNAGYIR